MFYSILSIFFISCLLPGTSGKGSFVIDYANDRFLKDGNPYRYISGSLHYFRIPRAYWNDRLSKMKAAGLNAIEFYIPWNYHELNPGQFDFTGQADVGEFLKLSHKHSLDVILRMGPYVCGEWDNGGLPWWLMNVEPTMKARTNDSRFISYVNKWYTKLVPIILPYLYKNGGPVIMIQVENEYGSFPACDRSYMIQLRNMFRQYFGDDVVLFTVDGGALSFLKCGYTPGLYPTIDFGNGDRQAIQKSFRAQRTYAPRGPLVNTEFYAGWLDLWGVNHSITVTSDILSSMTDMWKMGASFNFYMFHGGSTFGYWNGAVGNRPCVTSYDYDAPLDETGDPTEKYFQIRQRIQSLTGSRNTYPPASPGPKRRYGEMESTLIGSLVDLLHIWVNGSVHSTNPLTFEQLNFGFGFVLYETTLPANFQIGKNGGKLSVTGIRDRGYVMMDGEMQGILSNLDQRYNVPIKGKSGQKLQILVENLGRHTQGPLEQKGIVSKVNLDGHILQNWLMYPIKVEDLFPIIKQEKRHHSLKNFIKSSSNSRSSKSTRFTPSIYYSKFSLDLPIHDTFFYPLNWGKGQFFLNDFNVGRYWPTLGPQVTLYVPKTILKSNLNYALIFELEKPGNCMDSNMAKCSFKFIDHSILDKAVVGGAGGGPTRGWEYLRENGK